MAVAAAVAPAGAAAAERLSTPISGFKATGIFSDVTTGPDGRLWVAEPEPAPQFETTIGSIYSVSADGSSKNWSTGSTTSGILPTHIAASTDGYLWYSGDTDRIGRMSTGGVGSQYVISPLSVDAGGVIGELTPASNGAVWFSEANLGRIGRVSSGGSIQSFPVGVTPGRITTGPDGNVWFTVPATGKVGRLTSDGTVQVFDLPPLPVGDVLSAITAGGDGNIWAASAETFLKIGTDGSLLATYTLPGYTANTAITDMAAGSDGNVWFTETSPNVIGRVYPDGTFSTDSTKPYGNTAPSAITKGPNSDLYYVGTNDQGTNVVNDVVGRVLPTSGPHGAVRTTVVTTDTTATLYADENPEGLGTTAHFDWGVTNLYGSVTPDQTIPGSGVAPVTAVLNGLRPGTIYHYRLTATNANGTGQSGDYTFRTTGVASGPIIPPGRTIPPVAKGATANDTGGALAVQVTAAKLSSSGIARILLKCNDAKPCKGSVVITGTVGKKKSVVLAKKNTTVRSGASVKLGLRLSKAGAKAVRKAGKKGLNVLVTITVDGKKKRYRVVLKK